MFGEKRAFLEAKPRGRRLGVSFYQVRVLDTAGLEYSTEKQRHTEKQGQCILGADGSALPDSEKPHSARAELGGLLRSLVYSTHTGLGSYSCKLCE